MTASRDLPTGTATFVFTDIEGSTRLLQQLGDRYRAVQDRHAELVRAAVRAHHGHEVRTEGDSFFLAFVTAPDAVGAAVEIQRGMAREAWDLAEPLRVRIGIHTGEGVLGGGDYVGIDVNLAARIAAAGHGGQVLISDATMRLIERSLPDGVSVRSLGRHRLKDVEGPQQLHDLVMQGLPADFPPLRTLETPTNLPIQRSSFVGREREVGEVATLLQQSRLVTLTGPGGTGKTRLALRVAEREVDRFDHGVFLVDLSAVVDPDLVPSAIATALGVRDEPGRPLADTLADQLRDRRLLLVVDNMEQVVEAAPVVDRLLDAAPGLRVLATSRVPLRLSGEHEYAVRPLPLPDRPELEAASACESIMLFVQRAGAVRSGFRLTEGNTAVISGVVERLEGLPLAIELAATRMRALAPEELLERLDRRLPLLTTGTRDAPARQRTLRATIEWSLDLLEPPVQRLFARLAVFAGGWTLAAAEAVCGPALDIEVLDGMTTLVEHSLVRRGSGSPARFRMLETIRELAAERLERSGEAEELRRRHAWNLVEMVEGTEPEILMDPSSLDRLEVEHDNIRTALRWSIDGGDAEAGLRIAGTVWRFWQLRGHLAEGRQWVEDVLALPGAAERTAARAKALGALGSLAYYLRDPEHVPGPYEESLAISTELGDRAGEAEAAYNLSYARLLVGDFPAARDLLLRAEEIHRANNDPVQLAQARAALGHVSLMEGDLHRAEQLIRDARDDFQRAGHTWGVVLTSGELASVAIQRGDLEEARVATLRSLDGGEAMAAGDWCAVAIQGLAVLAIKEGEAERGVRLAGAADRLRENAGGEAPPAIVGLEDPLEMVGDRLPPDRVDALWNEGRAMSLDEAVAYARERS